MLNTPLFGMFRRACRTKDDVDLRSTYTILFNTALLTINIVSITTLADSEIP